jgi:hypothetical protein
MAVAITATSNGVAYDKLNFTFRHVFLEFAELFMFLLVAMTFINTMTERNVFEVLRSWLVNKGFDFRKIFIITGILSFFISPIADNLTTALLMCAVGDLDVTGSFDMSDANITNIGSIALDTITNDGTDITLDSSGDIVLDADGDQVSFKFGGATGQLDVGNANSGDITFSQETNAKDFVFLQYDNNEVMRISDSNFVSIGGNATSQGIVRFLEDSDNGSNYIAIQSPAANVAGADYTLTLPEVTGDIIPGKMATTNFTTSLIVGHSTTGSLSSAGDNVAVGVTAMDAITTADQTTAIGGNTLTALTTGQGNTTVVNIE